MLSMKAVLLCKLLIISSLFFNFINFIFKAAHKKPSHIKINQTPKLHTLKYSHPVWEAVLNLCSFQLDLTCNMNILFALIHHKTGEIHDKIRTRENI